MPKPKEPKKMGRPLVEIDVKQLKELMKLGPSKEDTANFFDCSVDTIERLIRSEFDLTFAAFREQNEIHTRLGIKRKMVQKAMAGDNTMLIWLSKNMLGMTDKIDKRISGQLDQNITTETPEQQLERIKSMVKEQA